MITVGMPFRKCDWMTATKGAIRSEALDGASYTSN